MGTWSREMTQYMPYRKYRQVEDIVGRENSVGKNPRLCEAQRTSSTAHTS